jgi:hypothetical protein
MLLNGAGPASTKHAVPACSGGPSPRPQAQQRKALGGLSRAVLDSTQTVGRGITSASGAVAGTVKQGVSELASAASGGVVKVTNGVAGAAGAVVGALAGPGSYEPQPGALAAAYWAALMPAAG